MRTLDTMTKIASITTAEGGWKAVFESENGEESQSRILAWGLTASGELVGLIVNPDDRRSIVAATDVTIADGGTFDRYAFRPA